MTMTTETVSEIASKAKLGALHLAHLSTDIMHKKSGFVKL